MTDRTPEQINHNIDQTLAICAETSRNLTRLEAAIEQTQQMVQDFIASAKPRLLSLETSREQDEERLEELENNRIRMERAHLEHQERMNSMAATAEQSRIEHQERMNSISATTEQLRADHQSRIDRQDRLIELLSRQIGTSDPLD
jgi:Na+-translocating ferredoxin:NAD+ oxidoreductase RnfC subunit